MKIIAIISQKGGAAKTTLATHLAVEAIRQGKQAAIIDLDPQASAARWKDLRTSATPVVLSAQAARLKEVFAQAQAGGIDLLWLDTAPHSDSIALAVQKNGSRQVIPGNRKCLCARIGQHRKGKLIGLELLQQGCLLALDLAHLQERDEVEQHKENQCGSHGKLAK